MRHPLDQADPARLFVPCAAPQPSPNGFAHHLIPTKGLSVKMRRQHPNSMPPEDAASPRVSALIPRSSAALQSAILRTRSASIRGIPSSSNERTANFMGGLGGFIGLRCETRDKVIWAITVDLRACPADVTYPHRQCIEIHVQLAKRRSRLAPKRQP